MGLEAGHDLIEDAGHPRNFLTLTGWKRVLPHIKLSIDPMKASQNSMSPKHCVTCHRQKEVILIHPFRLGKSFNIRWYE